MINYKPGKSGSRKGRSLLGALKYLFIGDSDKPGQTEKRLREYDRQHKNHANPPKRRVQSQSTKTSQDQFQQKQYKKQNQTKRPAQKQRQVKTTDGYQVPEFVVIAKKPAQKRSTNNTNSSRRTRVFTPKHVSNTRQRNTEPDLPLLNNPNYIDDNATSGIRFIPSNFDGYDDIRGRKQSQQILDQADMNDRLHRQAANYLLAQAGFDIPTISNLDEFASPDEYYHGKSGYWF